MAGLTPAGLSPTALGGASGSFLITSLSPSVVHTGGRTIIEIIGTGFRLPAIPPPSKAISVQPPPSVAVTFDGVSALNVAVVSSTRMIVEVPPSPLPITKPDYGEGVATVAFQNLDENGVAIPGETASFTGLSYQRPQLANEGIIARVTRYLLREIRLQVIANASISNNTDFDSSTDDLLQITELSKLPGIALVGPELTENMFYTSYAGPLVTDIFGDISRIRPAYTVDARYTVVGVSNSMIELLNLMTVVHQFLERTKVLSVPVDPSNLSLGMLRYELDVVEGDDMKVFGSPNESNIRSFSGSILVRGVDIGDIAGFAGDRIVEKTRPVTDFEAGFVIEQIGPDYKRGPSPGD